MVHKGVKVRMGLRAEKEANTLARDRGIVTWYPVWFLSEVDLC
jgi:hypothetical protein